MYTLTLYQPDGSSSVVGTDYPTEAAAEAAGVALQASNAPSPVTFSVSPT